MAVVTSNKIPSNFVGPKKMTTIVICGKDHIISKKYNVPFEPCCAQRVSDVMRLHHRSLLKVANQSI